MLCAASLSISECVSEMDACRCCRWCCGSFRVELCGRWGVVRGWGSVPVTSPFPFLCLLYPSMRGRIRSVPEYRSSHVTTPTSRYRKAYPSTEGSGGGVHYRTPTGVCRRWSRLCDVYRTVSRSLTGSLAMGVPSTARVTFQLLCSHRVSILQPCYC